MDQGLRSHRHYEVPPVAMAFSAVWGMAVHCSVAEPQSVVNDFELFSGWLIFQECYRHLIMCYRAYERRRVGSCVLFVDCALQSVRHQILVTHVQCNSLDSSR